MHIEYIDISLYTYMRMYTHRYTFACPREDEACAKHRGCHPGPWRSLGDNRPVEPSNRTAKPCVLADLGNAPVPSPKYGGVPASMLSCLVSTSSETRPPEPYAFPVQPKLAKITCCQSRGKCLKSSQHGTWKKGRCISSFKLP